MIYGSFLKRLKAFLIDYFLILITLSILWYVFSLPLPPKPNYAIGNLLFYSSPIAWLIGVFYYGIMESGPKQATYGKRAMGLKVTGKNGEHLSFQRAGARSLNKIFSSIFFLGYIMYFFNKRKQTFHDWLTNSIVITKESNPILTEKVIEDI
jgi:uncharacterized RDD family membrane protein YckC